MTEQMHDRADEEILVTDFSDEALEAAAASDTAQTTIFTVFTHDALKPCGCAVIA